MERQCMTTYNERQLRQFLAAKARALGYHGVSMVASAAHVRLSTVYRGIHELESNSNDSFPKGRIRNFGGGRKPIIEKHSGLPFCV